MQHVFVSLRDDNCIAVFQLSDTGNLRPLRWVDVPGGPAPIAANPSGTRLYVAQRISKHISSFAVANDGRLDLIGKTATRNDSNCMWMDRAGRYLLSSYYRGEGLHVHATDTDGVLIEEAVEWRDTALSAHCFMNDPSNRWAYACHISAGIGPNCIYQYAFDAESGALTPLDPPSITASNEAGPRHCCFHPTLPILYATNEQGGSITGYRIDTVTGTLREEETVPLAPPDWTGDVGGTQLRITTDGNWMFANVGGPDLIASLSVAKDGALSLASHIESESGPRAMGLDASERFLFSTGGNSGYISVFQIDRDTGILTWVNRAPLADGQRRAAGEPGSVPMWVCATNPLANQKEE